jgi:hypothetical protein
MRLSSFTHIAALVSLAAFAACRQPVAGPAPAPSTPSVGTRPLPPLTTGEAVVAAMHDRYVGRWYRTLTFKQKTSRLLPNGSWNVQTWYEALALPGRLRIDFDPLSAGDGVLYARDSQYVIQKGRVANASAGINDLLLLGFDIYANQPARTGALLRKQGFDLRRVHTESFEGRPMVVVGALQGDYHSKQFWVDTERMLFVRLLEPQARDTTKGQEIRFVNYQKLGEGWIAPRVEIHVDGKVTFTEDYTDIRTDVELDDALFEPTHWKTAKHWLAAR